jgi:hypothetical protein
MEKVIILNKASFGVLFLERTLNETSLRDVRRKRN